MKRNDQCFASGRRAMKLTPHQSAQAWQHLAAGVERLGDHPLPKYKDLMDTFQQAIKHGKTL